MEHDGLLDWIDSHPAYFIGGAILAAIVVGAMIFNKNTNSSTNTTQPATTSTPQNLNTVYRNVSDVFYNYSQVEGSYNTNNTINSNNTSTITSTSTTTTYAPPTTVSSPPVQQPPSTNNSTHLDQYGNLISDATGGIIGVWNSFLNQFDKPYQDGFGLIQKNGIWTYIDPANYTPYH